MWLLFAFAMKKFTQYDGLDLAALADDVLAQWKANGAFEQSLTLRQGAPSFVFYEGPPSANGTPGIHHVMARTIKDAFCRYKTQQGFRVERKAGWDTHGLPVELGVEKSLGITKEDIGKTISIEQYNAQCRQDVMKYTAQWRDLTEKMGYWVDMDNPYVTYENDYIETLWFLLKELYKKDFLYKGYTIQPYSPAAGTGLSNHELNQPGCYRDVKDTTCIAQFRVVDSNVPSPKSQVPVYFLAWTTTPWTLPSNTALAVGPEIEYVRVRTINPYSKAEVEVILGAPLLEKVMGKAEYTVVSRCKGRELEGLRYEQLMPWVAPYTQDGGDAFRVVCGDFVTTEDGTGIVHIAPTFGADDDRVAKQNGIAPLLMVDAAGKLAPMVDRSGKFFEAKDLDPTYVQQFIKADYAPWAGKFVKNAYDATKGEKDETLDVELCMWLKERGLAFKIEKHTHFYPHCWRTDKPVLYYPLDSWFIKTTAVRDRMIELNNTINWHPETTGSGRFGKWLENLVDWNLSRSRYWGTPLPIWATEDFSELKCIGSIEELNSEIEKAKKAGLMPADFAINDLHRPFVDDVVLVSDKGAPMRRESDLIDVWFDSGAMPYAQQHYMGPGTGDGARGELKGSEPQVPNFPADFIAEGVDQTRGWFFTLHALSVMLFDSVAFKNIISNGLVLDKNGNKMSKRLGNGVDPFEALSQYGADAVRWYMLSNSQPWDNLKFDPAGVDEVRRKFFGTLYNTYSFFALYANVDGYTGNEAEIAYADRPEIDRWIISLLNSLVAKVTDRLEDYDPTPAVREIAEFVGENLSNWYVRLNRKRFWGGEMNADKLSAYQTLHECLGTVAQLMAPAAPFMAERLWSDLSGAGSVHTAPWPKANNNLIDCTLEERQALAQRATSMVLALRRKVSIKVRQPLQKMVIPVLDPALETALKAVEELIKTEVNVKQIEFIHDTRGVITKQIKPLFPVLGKKHGGLMKAIAALVAQMDQEAIAALEADGVFELLVDGQKVELSREDVEITSNDMPGWLVATEGRLTIALDVHLTDELLAEGVARELVNRIQNLRKDSGFEVTDRIAIRIERNAATDGAVGVWSDFIAAQTLGTSLELTSDKLSTVVELDDAVTLTIAITKA